MKITKEKYYELMHNMVQPNDTFQNIYSKWKLCFSYILRSYKVGFNKYSINSLFTRFDMENWKAMHKENTEYANYSKKQLIESFNDECYYISDRASYDRLFRCHWLFKQAFYNELNKL